MLKTISPLLLIMLLTNCTSDSFDVKTSCATPATIRDLTGLDGCGFIFELTDGTRLEPIRIGYCGTPPLATEITEDPLYNFSFADGKKVFINYEIKDDYSVCMIGPAVKIICIREVNAEAAK